MTVATTLTIKTDRSLRDAAKHTASELGIPLTTIMNSMLRQFVRERKFAVSLEPRLSPQQARLYEKASTEMDASMKRGTQTAFYDAESLLAHLKLV